MKSLLYGSIVSFLVAYSAALNLFNGKTNPATTRSLVRPNPTALPTNGIIPYIGDTKPKDAGIPRWSTPDLTYQAPTSQQAFWTRWNLFRQYFWKKIGPKRVILKAKVFGSLPLESTPPGFAGFGAKPDFEPVDSLADFQTLLMFGAHDPRVEAVLLDIGGISAGYAKLQEARRYMSYFRQSGKRIIGYCSGGAEKELYLALGCDDFYIPPDGGLDLRGFSASATFVRGVFAKLGIEPQVQRIGKYKSFGDTFNRTSISEAQREVISSLLMEASDFWADSVASALNKTTAEVMQLWMDTGIKTPYDFKDLGFVTGVKYLDQVEDIVRYEHGWAPQQKPPGLLDNVKAALGMAGSRNTTELIAEMNVEIARETADFTVEKEFVDHPRRRVSDFNASALDAIALSFAEKGDEVVTQAYEKWSESQRAEDVKRLEMMLIDPLKTYSLKNSTEIREAYTFLTKMRLLYSKNIFPSAGGKAAAATAVAAAATEALATDSSGEVAAASPVKMTTQEQMAAAAIVLRVVYVIALKREHAQRMQKENFDKVRLLGRGARLFPAGLYLRKMRKGSRILTSLPVKEVRAGPRIVVINAVGGIGTGKSSAGGLTGKTLGSDTLIGMVRAARGDPNVLGVVLRVDSPGGSALASDLMWREIRQLSKEKPVVASMVDVAASGGYYIGMACDAIVAEELTVTGSIGVVTSKFNLKELNERIGYNTETLSRGRYAEVLSSSRGFTPEEESYFEEGAQKAYKSFITKAAASRSMDVEAMNEVAQGRVWTGRQALERGLVDEIGGLDKALWLVATLAGSSASPMVMKVALGAHMRVQTFREPKSGLPFPFGGGASIATDSGAFSGAGDDYLALCDESVACTGLVTPALLGVSPSIQSLGLNPSLAYTLSHSPAGAAVDAAAKLVMATGSVPSLTSAAVTNPVTQAVAKILRAVNEEIL